jgi:chaperonin GroES
MVAIPAQAFGIVSDTACILSDSVLSPLLALSCFECQRPTSSRLSMQMCLFSQTRRIIMAFRPLHDRVVVRRIDAEEKTKGGIIIPDTAKEKPQEGEIIAVGPGARDENGKVQALDVKAGDRVLFGKWSGTEVRIDGEDLLIMKESDIMGVLDEVATRKKAA